MILMEGMGVIERKPIEKLIGKYICINFSFDNDRNVIRRGRLKEVNNTCISVEFEGEIQLYSLDRITSVWEDPS